MLHGGFMKSGFSLTIKWRFEKPAPYREGIYGSDARIDLGEQPEGIYFARVFSVVQAVSRKLILQ